MHEILEVHPSCPWSDWARPNVRWCETPQCAWVVTPLNAYSNAFYLIAAFLMVQHERSRRSGRRSTTKGSWNALDHIPWATAFLGAVSFAFHASYTYFFQIWDYIGMFVVLAVMLNSGLQRSKLLKAGTGSFWIFIGVPTVLTFIFAHFKIKYQMLVAVIIVIGLALEVYFWTSPESKFANKEAKGFLTSLVLTLVAAATSSALDQSGLGCWPDSWIQGHTFWHLGTSIVCFRCYQYLAALARGE